MQIKTKTTVLGAVASVSIAVLILVSVLVQYSAFEVETRFESLEKTVTDIRLVDELASEVVFSPGPRVQRQWNTQMSRVQDSLERLFDGLDLSDGFKSEVAARLKTIDRTVIRLSDDPSELTGEMRTALSSRLNSNRNALFGQIGRIEAQLKSERRNLLHTSLIVIATTVLLTSTLIGVSLFIIRKTLVDSMRDINKGMQGLTTGRRNVAITTTRSDEIGDILRELEAVRQDIENAFAKEEEARQRAEDLSAAKSNFVATTSHELRTPLNGLLGSISVLEESDLTEEQAKFVRMAKSSGAGLLSIINDVLDFSKIETGSLEVDSVPFHPARVLNHIRSTYATLAEKRGVELVVESFEKEATALIGDPTRVQQILSNLAGNAIKFTKDGSVTIHATLNPEGQEGYQRLRFTVTDTGIGIPEDKLTAIFDPFQQAENSTTRQYGGSGLGLSISKKLVELMGGEISVDSTLGQGSVFGFSLSLMQTDGVLVDTGGSADNQALHNSLPDLRVLLVDDVDINRIVAAEMLRKWGCQVAEACDGFEAVNLVRKSDFDVVLMDVQMPGMDGVEATRQIRFSGNRVPVIGLTANAFNDQRREYLDAGMDHVVPKPIDWQALYGAVKQVCSQGDVLPLQRPNPQPPPPNLEIGQPAVSVDTSRGETEYLSDTVLASLRTIMSLEELKSLSGDALDRVEELMEEANADQIAERDLRNVGHTMKGMCGNVGFAELSRLGERLEEEGGDCDLPGWSEDVRLAMQQTQACLIQLN